jgi:hypothetical protein
MPRISFGTTIYDENGKYYMKHTSKFMWWSITLQFYESSKCEGLLLCNKAENVKSYCSITDV